jgi:hypothetical protein
MGEGGQRHDPAALSPGKTPYPSYRVLGGPQGRSGRARKTSPPPGFDPRTVKGVASRYTDYTIQGISSLRLSRNKRHLYRMIGWHNHSPSLQIIQLVTCVFLTYFAIWNFSTRPLADCHVWMEPKNVLSFS